ncbi:helix-turn-helix transcriptional regulator [Sphingopyxis lindanitolerans]|jgi:DNA-binding CsgD family transcriptional regulator|uniref:Helix-turn-helix transcriptional regulator n=1 Tax=Sphingopyxis lindanitolerans TaxID=2054227 RepID=A0A2S8B0P3_9SPHN|nr:helix-turn-helix transcriptional regulator [Sphingopyxis lindanitolerans]PQM25917.1 helix-turn-helix transcriptional regulator [Sphingopyxis lindanitolerans]
MTDSGSYPSDEAARWARLTDKQRACLDLLLERQTSKQIARRLNISKQAVDLRLTTARDVLGAANRDETAILYARLRSTYDRIPCDPVILPPRPELVPSDFPDGNPADVLKLHDRSAAKAGPSGSSPPFGIFWRRDYRPSTRVAIIMAMLIATLLMIIAGLAIGHSLTRLISG